MTDINPNMSLDDAVPTESKYLKKEDVGLEGKNLKIAGLSRADLKEDGSDVQTVINFTTSDNPMVLKKTNLNLLKHYSGGDKVSDIIGKTFNFYNKPTVEYRGKIVGGIRIRAEVVAGGGTMGRDEAIAKHGNADDAGPAPTGPVPFDDDPTSPAQTGPVDPDDDIPF